MTKKLECMVEGCDATIEGETEEEVVGKATEHAQEEHPDLELNDETVMDIKSNIEDA